MFCGHSLISLYFIPNYLQSFSPVDCVFHSTPTLTELAPSLTCFCDLEALHFGISAGKYSSPWSWYSNVPPVIGTFPTV
ncbi:hypothetical protein FUAX_50730 (plasmid) [Fulvitalea axinellae]|uniref:Uncharacterized protein n=1 Tax=Fulvitalea axinellae TaxID=1182444 RepID=A0AAU9DHS4_9BACT|nr:hypothetical protein FUAX_50730 [Fulvitalea axinellae]